MRFRPQTAIRGIASVAAINVATRVVGYGKHAVIAAYIGLTAPLDAYYVALTALSIAVLSFGDVFDSLGIPRLVNALQSGGEEAFRKIAGSILAFAILLALALTCLLYALSPWVPRIAPGLSPDSRGLIVNNLFCLVPLALVYLPYHAVGSFLRARRRFQAFFSAEFLATAVSLGCVYAFRNVPFVVPLAHSAGFLAAAGYLFVIARGEYRVTIRPDRDILRELFGLLVRLLPLYLLGYLYNLVDRAFASYLPTGGISALSYGYLIVLIPSSILMMESIFITPLAEAEERGDLMRRILTGVLVTSVPIALFTVTFAEPIVRAALERGVFTRDATEMTAEAVRYYALGIPAIFLAPTLNRLFQVLGRLRGAGAAGLAAVALNALLNAIFLKLGLGIQGLALATSIAFYAFVAVAFRLLARLGVDVATRKALPVLCWSAAAGGCALGLVWLFPLGGGTSGLLLRGAAFLAVTGVLLFLAPNGEIKSWRETVSRELLPLKRSS